MVLPKTIDTFGIWVQFTGYYFHELHDLFLNDGTIIKSAFPTETGWGLRGSDKDSWLYYIDYCSANNVVDLLNKDIVAIRLLTDKDIVERRLLWETGHKRLKRITDSFGEGKQYAMVDNNDLIKDHKIAIFVNDIRDIAVKYGASQQLREHVSRRTKKLLINLMYKR